jgi:hypothetical protein
MTARLPDMQPFDAILGCLSTPVDFDTFITLRGYRPAHGGVSHYVIRAIPYRTVLRQSLELAQVMTADRVAQECPAADGDVGLAARVLGAVRASLTRSLEQGGLDPRYTLVAPGLMRHRRTGALYVSGLVVRRQSVVRALNQRTTSSREARIRRWIESRLPTGAWRKFKLERENWTELKIGDAVLRASEDAPAPPPEQEATFDPFAYGFGKVSAEEGWRYSG